MSEGEVVMSRLWDVRVVDTGGSCGRKASSLGRSDKPFAHLECSVTLRSLVVGSWGRSSNVKETLLCVHRTHVCHVTTSESISSSRRFGRGREL